MPTWLDRIDAHDTGGKAEEAVANLNAGYSEKLVASLWGVQLCVVHYLCAHEGYGVKPKILRNLAALERQAVQREWSIHGREMKALEKAISSIRKVAKRGSN